jgi:S1/P1 Nuclease
MRKWLLFVNLCFCLLPTGASAWWDEGHMQIAAVAYERLTPDVRAKADALIRLNPEYANWVAGYPARNAAQYAFVRAAIWADDIKNPAMGYTEKGDRPTTDQAAQNIGYHDNLMHKYWHFKDIGFSTDGTRIEDADPVNALTQIKVLTAGLAPSSGLPDEVRSYDLVWLLHLVGDVHQPLHATARFSHALPHGDQGGNKEVVVPATGEKLALHFYWDRLLGSYSTPEGAIQDALVSDDTKLPDPDPTLAMNANPDDWLTESEKLAEANAYAEPVKSGTQPYMLDRQYETNARNIARQQAALAGARLANLINAALK